MADVLHFTPTIPYYQYHTAIIIAVNIWEVTLSTAQRNRQGEEAKLADQAPTSPTKKHDVE
eukprot:scaffold426_cov219-Amphora_coffeaeformis.AAC.15